MIYSADHFETLFQTSTRWIDVRAPVEFRQGSLPNSVNLPILEDLEREAVGKTYKAQGPPAAIELGHSLVRGDVRARRQEAWIGEIRAYPQAVIYCARGGLRSQTTQEWLAAAGIQVPRVEGGYKALRRFLIDTLEAQIRRLDFEVVAGPTGSGKTDYLRQASREFIDLEALAHHRGSVFGAHAETQPTQIDFENTLALSLTRLSGRRGRVLIEDESRQIGVRTIPLSLFQKMQQSPKFELRRPFDERVETIFRVYVLESPYVARRDVTLFADFKRAVTAIGRRLGSVRAGAILADLEICQREFLASGELGSNRVWIAKLLKWYYDPLYDRSFEGKNRAAGEL